MNILLTSAGRRTYLIDYFKEVVGNTGKVFASNSIYTYSLSHADDYVLTPQIYDTEYIDFLLEYCKKNNIKAVISLFDIDLPILSKNKEQFAKEGTNIIASSPDVIKICNDKWLTYRFLTDNGINTPKSYLNIEDVLTAVENNTISFPLIIKPRWGMGSIGIYKADNIEELNIFYSKLKREIFNTYLRFESQEDCNHCVIIQQKINGSEYGLDVLNDLDGNYVTTIAKKKIAMRSGETDIAEIIDPAPFLSCSKKLSTHLRHIANMDVDCFMDTDSNIYILELNCRFGGQYPFSHLAGVNFPKQIVEWLSGNKTDMKNVTPVIGTVSCKDLVPVIIKNNHRVQGF